MALARFADLHTDIHDTGCQTLAPAVDDGRALGGGSIAHDRDKAVLDGQGAFAFRKVLGVDQTGVDEVKRHLVSACICRIS